MRFLVDECLPPRWAEWLAEQGHEAEHWCGIGTPRATDQAIAAFAAGHDYVVLTHDLDFGTLLVRSGAQQPSIIQIRDPMPLPESCGRALIAALTTYADALTAGAIVTIDEGRIRCRPLPLAEE